MKRNLQALLGASLLSALGAGGCDAPRSFDDVPPDRVEVFYRDFEDPPAFVHWSEESAVRSATLKLVLKDRRQIKSIQDRLAIACVTDPEIRGHDPDVYLVVREYRGSKLLRSFVASPFHFARTPEGSDMPCKLPPDEREKISALLADLAHSNRR